MKVYLVEKKENFIGREFELARIEHIEKQKKSQIVVVYGRRRIGKTELLEQAFRQRNLLKIEGREDKQSLNRCSL